jgi:oligopeptide transport system substrate-binding protein
MGVAACGAPAGGTTGGAAPPATGKGAPLTVAIASSPETIDPQMNSSLDGASYLIHFFEGLARVKRDGIGVEYGQAESHTVSDDGLVWTFTLRENAKWSDGQPVTARDFEYAWKRLVDPNTAAPYGGDMGMYVKNGAAIYSGEKPVDELGVRVIDDRTFEVTLENPCAFFMEIAAFPTYMPVRRDMIEKEGDAWVRSGATYITNGPFKLSSFTLDDKMVMIQNPNYWDIANIVPSQLTFLFLPDTVAELAAFRSGEISLMATPPQEESKALEAEGLWHGNVMLGTYYASFNTQIEPFNNPLVRKALTLAVDTKYIAEVVREGHVKPAEAFVGDGFSTSGFGQAFRANAPKYVSPSNYEANKEAAKQALAEAGYPDGAGIPKIEYLYNEDTGHRLIGEALQQMWKEVLNINVELRSAEWAVVLEDRRKGNFQMARNGWIGDYNDPATMLTLFLSNSGNNDGKYNSPEYDSLIGLSMAATDPTTRNELLHQAEDVLLGKDWALIPIYYYLKENCWVKNLKGYVSTPLGYDMFFGAYLE